MTLEDLDNIIDQFMPFVPEKYKSRIKGLAHIKDITGLPVSSYFSGKY
jgi:hypothetical protein